LASPDTSVMPLRLQGGLIREFLTFLVGGEAFGVPLTQVQEIRTFPLLTEVPRAPKDVMGICSVRGILVTVIDIRERLHVEQRPPSRTARILLTESTQGESLGIFVDEVIGVQRFAEGQIEAPSTGLVGDVASHIEGIGRRGNKVTVLLNLTWLTG
jgi:purine-binding chemotaxis protein CheW